MSDENRVLEKLDRLADGLAEMAGTEKARVVELGYIRDRVAKLEQLVDGNRTQITKWQALAAVVAAVALIAAGGWIKSAVGGDGDSFNEEFVGEFDGYHYDDGEAGR